MTLDAVGAEDSRQLTLEEVPIVQECGDSIVEHGRPPGRPDASYANSLDRNRSLMPMSVLVSSRGLRFARPDGSASIRSS